MLFDGVWEATNKQYVNITFNECEPSLIVQCLSAKEIDDFLAQHFFTVVSYASFIDFDSVLPKDETLQRIPKLDLWVKIDRKVGVTHWTKINEHYAELQDDRINFMGLSPAKEFTYWNTDDRVRTFEYDWS